MGSSEACEWTCPSCRFLSRDFKPSDPRREGAGNCYAWMFHYFSESGYRFDSATPLILQRSDMIGWLRCL